MRARRPKTGDRRMKRVIAALGVKPQSPPPSPLTHTYQNGSPVPWATNPNDDAYGGRPGSQGMPLVSGVIRGVLDAADTGTNALGSVFSTKADADATRARLAADRDAWEKQYGDSLAAKIGRVGGQLISTAGPVGLIGKGVGLAAGSLPAALRLLTQGAAQGGTQAGMTASASDESTGATGRQRRPYRSCRGAGRRETDVGDFG